MAAVRKQLGARCVSLECQQLLLALLQPREAGRPLAREALAHPWFQQKP